MIGNEEVVQEIGRVNEQHQRLLFGLQDMYHSGTLHDIILNADDIHIPCHRIILAASSAYFR